MVDRTQIESKCREMLFTVSQELYTSIERMLDSGALDFAQYANDYRLPKLLLCVALDRVREGYLPHSRDDTSREEMTNLYLYS